VLGVIRPESAAQHLVTEVPRAGPEDRIDRVVSGLCGPHWDVTDTIWVLDPDDRLVGMVPLERLLASRAEQTIRDIMAVAPASVGPEADQERVASVALLHRLASVPVLDPVGRLLGVVPPRALLAILRREHLEDLQLLVGIRKGSADAREALEGLARHQARDRLPWLLVGLAGSVVSAWVVSLFAPTLEATIAISFFVPGIVYLADAIGTQTETIVIRGLSVSHLPLRRLLAVEARTGVLIGAVLAAVAFPGIFLVFRDARLALAVGASILVAGAAATTIGLLLPWLLHRSGRDAALGSGPLATIIQDVLSLVIYFALASLLLD
jgi:magnesium transporter